MARDLALGALALALAACSSESTLVVQVRTDLLPGADFTNIEVELTTPPGSTTSRPATDDTDWGTGVRVAELALEPGEHRLAVRALGPDGSTVVERPVRATLDDGVTVVTVLLTRDCATVSCPDAADADATACLGGRCVPEGCSEETPELCPMPECTADAECLEGASSCARATCTPSGTCFVEPDHGMCTSGDVCSVGEGCVSACEPGQLVWARRYGLGLYGARDVAELTSGRLVLVGTEMSTLEQARTFDIDADGEPGLEIGTASDRNHEAIAVDPAGDVVIGATSAGGGPCVFYRLDATAFGPRDADTILGTSCALRDMIAPFAGGLLAVGESGGRAALFAIDADGAPSAVATAEDVGRSFHAVSATASGYVAVGTQREGGSVRLFSRTLPPDLSGYALGPDRPELWSVLDVAGVRGAGTGFELFAAVSERGFVFQRMRSGTDGGGLLDAPVLSGVDVRVEDAVFFEGGYALAETHRVGGYKAIAVTRWDDAHTLLWTHTHVAEEPARASAITRTMDGDFVVAGAIGPGEAEFYALRIHDAPCAP